MRLPLLIATCLVCGCAEEHRASAPRLQPEPEYENVVVCDALKHNPQPNNAGRLIVDGGEAGCFAEGQQCPIAQLNDTCDGGMAWATCTNGLWEIACRQLDAGVGDGPSQDAPDDRSVIDGPLDANEEVPIDGPAPLDAAAE